MNRLRHASGVERTKADASIKQAFNELLEAYMSEQSWDDSDKRVATIIEDLDERINSA
jgi:hypothetical protein